MTLLDCDEMKYFWLKWIEGELSFGQGLQVGSGVLATIADNDVHAEYDTAKYSWLDMSTLSTGADFEKQCGTVDSAITRYTLGGSANEHETRKSAVDVASITHLVIITHTSA
ncbi:hypothetical protein CAPTEDRAFT_202596 [Capitella teleta]|uniref:Uncharacterized protein n=1 Tax=Capitella teleta TaxID=283909 RepID=R7UN78_CAPTE|nr:hypothetical protein CAPTEDRAFT_202596 [Capitella teleta]|eukprot:ELU07665.1 hypothetical protein CAPTEDRAFT_202596 [Capitella teleta]